VVDVFTTEALAGNALAVFPEASELDETTMRKIAGEPVKSAFAWR
jgi:predicted PhzF superfamily epimerase YddE/YHI9